MRRAAWTFTVLMLAAGFAGCVGSDLDDGDGTTPGERPEAGTLVCLEGECNFEATLTPESRQANELSIAVNPTDPKNLIASGKDYTPSHAGDCVWDGIYTTHDGGVTWNNANLPGSPWYLQSNPADAEPHPELSKFWCATDPVVAFGPDGTAYWTVMPYQCDRASGSKTGDGVHPNGGFNDWLWTCSSMYVLVSEDGGDTWPIVQEVAFGPRLEHDKQWMSVAPNGDVLLCWDRSDQVEDDGTPVSQLRPQGQMVCSVSQDKGRSWADWQSVNPDWAGFLPWVDHGPDNTAWMAALDASQVLVSRSDDGLSWDDPVVVGEYTNPPPNGEFGWPALHGSVFRTFALPTMAVDRTDGPYSGSLYVAWFTYVDGHGEIHFTYSRDDGETWSDPVRIRDEGANPDHDQFMPAIAAGPDGTVDLIWYDRRDDPDNHTFALYHAYSVDGGVTWSENLKVSEHLSDEQYSHHQNGMIFLGDYIDIDASPGTAHVVWVDTRNEKADVYVAHVDRPGANPEAAA